MRGEAEQKCLDLVKTHMNDEIFFAMSYEDDQIVKSAFREATANPDASRFPDFIFDCGFIEHFQVTSSFENRKGSTMQREKSDINREFDRKAREATENLPEDSTTIQSVGTAPHWHKTHSYENFMASFKSNFESHLQSRQQYPGDKTHGIFLIEYTDAALCMSKSYAKDLMLEVSYGDLLTRENPAYRLSRDISLLRYIYEKRNEIEYVVFVDENCFHGTLIDIIKTANALEVIKLLHEGYEFHCAMVASSHYGIGVSVPKKRENDTDE